MTQEAGLREAWIDVARGGCVLLVVLYHVVIWHLWQAGVPGVRTALWTHLNDVVGGIRMPLLLMLSGLLAAGKIRRGRPAVRAAAANYWIYLVWLAVYALALPWMRLPRVNEVPPNVDGLEQLVAPETPLWYAFALAVYLLGMLALRRLPRLAVLGLLVVPILLISPGERIDLKIPVLAFYFAVGVYCGGWLRETARSRAWLLVVAGAVLVVVASRMNAWLPHGYAGEQAIFTVGNLGRGFAAMGLAVWVSRVGLLRRTIGWVGRNTLPIYVLHPVLLAFWMWVTLHTSWLVPGLRATGPLAVAYPLLLMLAIAALALAIERCLQRAGLGVLFALPSRWMTRLRTWERCGLPEGPVSSEATLRGTPATAHGAGGLTGGLTTVGAEGLEPPTTSS